MQSNLYWTYTKENLNLNLFQGFTIQLHSIFKKPGVPPVNENVQGGWNNTLMSVNNLILELCKYVKVNFNKKSF